MVPTPHRRTVMMVLGGLALLAVSGCGGGATTSTPTKASTTAASSAASQTYSSKAFVLPLTVTVDAALESPPNPDSHNLLSWDSASIDKWVRFLVPVNLYRPGSSVREAVPKDYLKYLQGQTKDNVEFSDVTKITVDGHPATLMTATSTIDASHPQGFLDGSLGCPKPHAEQHEGCYGIQPQGIIRLAVVDVGGTTLLAWARTNKDHPDQAFDAMFERMLTSVRFR
jgi:hypothetical protein